MTGDIVTQLVASLVLNLHFQSVAMERNAGRRSWDT